MPIHGPHLADLLAILVLAARALPFVLGLHAEVPTVADVGIGLGADDLAVGLLEGDLRRPAVLVGVAVIAHVDPVATARLAGVRADIDVLPERHKRHAHLVSGLVHFVDHGIGGRAQGVDIVARHGLRRVDHHGDVDRLQLGANGLCADRDVHLAHARDLHEGGLALGTDVDRDRLVRDERLDLDRIAGRVLRGDELGDDLLQPGVRRLPVLGGGERGRVGEVLEVEPHAVGLAVVQRRADAHADQKHGRRRHHRDVPARVRRKFLEPGFHRCLLLAPGAHAHPTCGPMEGLLGRLLGRSG